jgi:predicted secreted Zn-dependent protease
VRSHTVAMTRTSFLSAGAALCLAACASAPRNPVLDKYPAGVEGRTSVSYYDVHGRSYAELHADMRRLGPKNNGTSFVGETRSPMTWSWRAESITGGSCTLRDVRVSVNAEILLPRWTPAADVDTSLVTEWNRFIAALETHEAGHKDISAKAGRAIKDELRSLTGLCSQVSMRANDIARRIIDRASEEQKRYDADTQHGLAQGTGFGPRGTTVSYRTPSGEVISTSSAEARARVEAARARADSEAARVTRLLVTPRRIELKVGDVISSATLYGKLTVTGLTAQGDTLTAFGKSFMLEPNPRLVRTLAGLEARRAGDANLWVLTGTRPDLPLRESDHVVLVVIHIR